MDQPSAQQPAAKTQPVVPATVQGAPGTTTPPPTESPKPKLPLLIAGIAAVLVLAVLVTFAIVNQKRLQPVPSPAASADFSKLPEKNLSSANGQVVAVSAGEKKVSVRSSNPRPDGSYITWTVTVTNETIVAKFSDWARVSGGQSDADLAAPPKTAKEIKSQVPSIRLETLKVGDSVYLIAGQNQDLTTLEEIEGPRALLLQTAL